MEATSSLNAFLSAHPEIQIGRDAYDRLEALHAGTDSFGVTNKPFENMVMHQEFNADTLERLYVVAMIDDQKALDNYKEDCGGEIDTYKCDCAEDQGAEHFIYERVVVFKEPDCKKHDSATEPDPDCSACWPVMCGNKCTPSK
ncbi:hypothetical protein CC79DRAFT_1332909 [Sarocladium strictum]|jgi:hypothetical protein